MSLLLPRKMSVLNSRCWTHGREQDSALVSDHVLLPSIFSLFAVVPVVACLPVSSEVPAIVSDAVVQAKSLLDCFSSLSSSFP